MNTTSLSLLRRLREPSDSRAWELFADIYTPLIYYWARQLGLQQSDAADLVQDVMLLLVRKLPAFEHNGQGRFRGWLHTVVLNTFRMSRRQVVPGQAGEADLANLHVPDTAEALGDEEYRQYLTRRALQVMQAQFQPSTWQACWLQVVEGLSAAEVSAQLGISEGAAYVARSRVLRRLREELEGLLD